MIDGEINLKVDGTTFWTFRTSVEFFRGIREIGSRSLLGGSGVKPIIWVKGLNLKTCNKDYYTNA